MRRRPLLLLFALVFAGTACPHERTTRDVVDEHIEAWEGVRAKVRKIRTMIETLPPMDAPQLDLGALPPPRFAAPPSLPGNAVAMTLDGLNDLALVPDDPLGLGERDSLHQLAAWLSTGADLDGHALLPVDTVEGWFAYAEQLQYLMVVDVQTWETPSYIMETLIPGKAAAQVLLFDLKQGRPLGGYRIEVVSAAAAVGPRPNTAAMTATLRRSALEAIRKGLTDLVPGAVAPFEAQLRAR